MRFIITCSGRQKRWGNYLGTPKHLVNIDGEPLLHRTVRMIKQFVPEAEVYIMSFLDSYNLEGTMRFPPQCKNFEEHYDSPAIYASRIQWSPTARTTVIFGDVFFTEEALKKICLYDDEEYVFFGREGGSGITNCLYGELWGISFLPTQQLRLTQAMLEVKALKEKGEVFRWGGWETYRFLQGTPLDEHRIEDNFVEINDLTEDFDFPEDYDNWLVRWIEFKETGKIRFKHHPIKFKRSNFTYFDFVFNDKVRDDLPSSWIEIYCRNDERANGPGLSWYISGYEVFRGDVTPSLGHCHWNISQTGNLDSVRLYYPRTDVHTYYKMIRWDIEHNLPFAKSFSQYPEVKAFKVSVDQLAKAGEWVEKTLREYGIEYYSY